MIPDRDEREVAIVSVASSVDPKKCDGRLHGLISDAEEYKGEEWWKVAFDALKAAAAEGQLRPGVAKRFSLQCPSQFSELTDQVGKLPLAASVEVKKTSPLGVGDKPPTAQERAAEIARRVKNRQARIEAQPHKGNAGGGGKNNSGGNKNGGKKK